jgi:serine/threonine protein kinase/WD40 repeat protein
MSQALEEYLAATVAGTAPPREEFLARHPELAEDLDACLAALHFIGQAAPGPRSVVAELAEVQPPEQTTGQLGDFRILREVGRGGMGIVYEAEQVSLGRRVALKVLPFAATMDSRQLQRFHNEARAAASLDHPHIVHVHAVGCDRAVHFYAMQFIDGPTLAAMIADLRQRGGQPALPEAQPTTPHIPGTPESAEDTGPQAAASTERGPRDRAYFRQVAEWGIQAAEALDHAHTLGIVHRDVKPANLLVDGRGGLWVTDFGLAHIQSDSRLTMTGDLVGTLRYMSPEQALAKRVVVDHRTDVYSLGATLYELLTLEPAFTGNDRQELLRQIAFEEPKAPRRINKAIPAELETIVLKAMEKNPADRYATAKELADDLRRWLEERTIQARPPSLVQRARKWMRRHAAIVRVAASALIVTAGVLVLSTILVAGAYESEKERRKEADQARDEKEQQRKEADEARKDEKQQRHNVERERDAAQRRLYNTQMHLAWKAWQDGSLQLVQERLNAYIPQLGERDLRGWEWYYLNGLANRALITMENQLADRNASPDDWNTIAGLAFSPDGRRLACALDVSISGEWQGYIIVREADTGREIFRRPRPGEGHSYVRRLEWSPGGERLTCFSQAGLSVWDGTSGKELFSRVCASPHDLITSAAWSPDGKSLAVAWCHGEHAATGSIGEVNVEIWEPSAGKVTHTLRPSQVSGPILASVAWSPDSRRLATVRNRNGTGDRILVWDLPSERQAKEIATDLRSEGLFLMTGIWGLAWSPDGQSIAWSGRRLNNPLGGSRIGIWKADTGEEVLHTRELPPWTRPGLAWTSDGRFLIVGRYPGDSNSESTVLLLNAGTGNIVFETAVSGMANASSELAVSPDGGRLATTSKLGAVKVWDIASGRETAWIRGHTANASAVA